MLPEFTVVKYDEKKAADDFAKVESTEKFVSSLLGQFKTVEQIELPEESLRMPEHKNIRGKDYYE